MFERTMAILPFTPKNIRTMTDERKNLISIFKSGDIELALTLAKAVSDVDMVELCCYAKFKDTTKSIFHKNDYLPTLIGYNRQRRIALRNTMTIPQSIIEGGIMWITIEFQDVDSLDFSNVGESTTRFIFKNYLYSGEIDGFESHISECGTSKYYDRIVKD